MTTMRIFTSVLLLLFAFTINAQQVDWLTWDEAVALTQNEGNTKKVFIDVYTDWCRYLGTKKWSPLCKLPVILVMISIKPKTGKPIVA